MSTRINILLILLLSITIMACKSKKNGNDNGKLKKRSSKYLLEKLDRYHIDAEWLSTKGNIKLTQAGKTNKATAYLRMRKDSVIWGAVRKFGIEGGRLLITPDSFFLVNRLEKNYYAKPISYVRDMMGLASNGDELSDFRNLYDLILGNPIFLDDTKYDVEAASPFYHLSKSLEDFDTEYWLNGTDYTLNKMQFRTKNSDRTASCTQENYNKPANDLLFSYIRKLDLYSSETGALKVELDLKKVSLNQPVSIKFEIPDTYDKID